MLDFEWDPNYVPPVKLGLHCAQILLGFVAWCLEIAVFRSKDAKIVGNNGWTFGVCFLSIPAWIYLLMTPRFNRTRKFAEPHAMLVVDVVFIIIWLSAFATQAAYNGAGQCGEGCGLSKGIVGLGVLITLLFAASSFISGYTLQYYNFHGNLPGYDSRKMRGGENIDPDKAAFSMAPHDDEAYERVNMDDHEASGSGAYGDANPYSADDYDDPNRYGSMPSRTGHSNSGALFDSETAYSSGPSTVGGPLSSSPYGGQTYHEEPAQFPAGNYDRVVR